MTDRLPLLLRVRDVQRELACSRSHVYKLMDRGDLAYVRDGRLRRVTRDSLLRYVARQTRSGPEQESA